MEKTVLQQKETYMDSVHRWGRIWGLGLMLLILAYPITVSLIFHAQVNWPAFVKGFIAIGPMYWAVGIVEIFTYVPMLGAGGSYLSFVTGNISNLKLPCALDAMERAGVKSNSEEGEIISTIAIAVSSIVTTLIIIVGVVLIVPLTPLLSSPVWHLRSRSCCPRCSAVWRSCLSLKMSACPLRRSSSCWCCSSLCRRSMRPR